MKRGTLKTFDGKDPKDKTPSSLYKYKIVYEDGTEQEEQMKDSSYGYDMVFEKILEKFGSDERQIVELKIELV